MPIYEFLCADCGRKSSFLTRSVNSPLEPVCRACSSSRMQRAVSSFAIGKTTQQVHDKTGRAPTYPDGDFYEDPRNIGRNVEETFQKNDMLRLDSIREAIHAAREGRPPVGLDL